MNRRDTVKTLLAGAGALVALPSWAESWSAAELGIRGAHPFVGGEATLAAVADTIIPAGNAIGALSVGVDKFLVKLFADCYEKDVRDNIQKQLDGLEKAANAAYNLPFSSCTPLQREQMLLRLAGSDDPSEHEFFTLVKAETIRGFNTSREVMVSYHRFRQVPGHYFGCVDVNP